ncbi:hypothetical protein [Methylobacterium sp. J-078]|uniref:hypothetical protein n=1 Tax=Methylobacterium sp. J-078 TaxID=2836657 RepID=UPI001FBA441D|nr:hypothetical protein [Methylobacterium sp. J-078]
MKTFWRHEPATAYSSTSSSLPLGRGQITDLNGAPNISRFLPERMGDIPENVSPNFGGSLITGRPTFNAKQNFLDVFSSRLKPDDHHRAEATAALKRLAERKDEDVDLWAENLAKSSLHLGD